MWILELLFHFHPQAVDIYSIHLWKLHFFPLFCWLNQLTDLLATLVFSYITLFLNSLFPMHVHESENFLEKYCNLQRLCSIYSGSLQQVFSWLAASAAIFPFPSSRLSTLTHCYMLIPPLNICSASRRPRLNLRRRALKGPCRVPSGSNPRLLSNFVGCRNCLLWKLVRQRKPYLL